MKHIFFTIYILLGASFTFVHAACNQNKTEHGTCTDTEISQKKMGVETSSCGACPSNKLCVQDFVVQYATPLTKNKYLISFADPVNNNCPCPPSIIQCSDKVIEREESVEIGQRLENLRCVEIEENKCYYVWDALPGSECSGRQVITSVVPDTYDKFQIDGEWYYYVLVCEETYNVTYTRYVAREVHNCGNGKPCTLEKIEGIFRCGTPEKTRELLKTVELKKGPYKF